MTDPQMTDWKPIANAPRNGMPLQVRGTGWPVTAVWREEPHHTCGWVFADTNGRALEVEMHGSLTYVEIACVTEWREVSHAAPAVPAPVGSGEVRAADPFPGVVEALEHIPPKRDNGSGGG